MKRSIFFGALICALLAMFAIWKVKATVDGASALCGGSQFGDIYYWSSSQYASNATNACGLNFSNGNWNYTSKGYDYSVCAIRAFFISKISPKDINFATIVIYLFWQKQVQEIFLLQEE
ncbi:hypothetical protein [Treponema sp.]|uniref:hypothetical protein n=1 Tax=Treponema sp. TaxID=166 RepID=UPI00298E03ED|nr:hypothetical protein [Treponema sp.]